jgi:hypothetical protein
MTSQAEIVERPRFLIHKNANYRTSKVDQGFSIINVMMCFLHLFSVCILEKTTMLDRNTLALYTTFKYLQTLVNFVTYLLLE